MPSTLAFAWSPALATGDANIDRQHQQIFEYTNKLLDSIIEGTSRVETAQSVLDFLDTYIIEHFAYEEGFMLKEGYPDMDRHHDMHADFSRRYASLKDILIKSDYEDSHIIELESFIGNWLTAHILQEDMKYVFFIRGKNNKSDPTNDSSAE